MWFSSHASWPLISGPVSRSALSARTNSSLFTQPLISGSTVPFSPSLGSHRCFSCSSPTQLFWKYPRTESFRSYGFFSGIRLPEDRIRLKRCSRQKKYSNEKYELEKYLRPADPAPMNEWDRELLRVLWKAYQSFPTDLKDLHESKEDNPFWRAKKYHEWWGRDRQYGINTTVMLLNEIVEHNETGVKEPFELFKGLGSWDRKARLVALGVMTDYHHLGTRYRRMRMKSLHGYRAVRVASGLVATFFIGRDLLAIW